MKLFLHAFVVGVVLLVASRAVAQEAPISADESARREEARARFEEGVRLYTARTYDAALAEFRRSVDLFPTRTARQNLGLSLKTLGRYDEAAEVLEATVRDYPKMKQEDHDFLVNLLNEIAAKVGRVAIRTREAEANITIDSVERGKTPRDPVRVNAGPHILRVAKEGFVPFEARIVVPPKETLTVDVELGPLLKSGRLRVMEDQSRKLRVILDGVDVGEAPWEGAVGVGPHAVQLRGPDMLGSPLASVVIEEQRLAKVTLLAEPLRCRLRVSPVPVNAQVVVDGVGVGIGAWSGPIRCGGHRVEVSADAFVTSALNLSVSEAQEREVSVVLDRDPGYGKVPTRVIVGASIGGLLFPSFGGAPAAACGTGCSTSVGGAVHLDATVGARFGTGLGVGLSAGYFAMGKSYTGRSSEITPVGRDPALGTSNDSISARGPRLAVFGLYEAGDTWRYSGRVAGGLLFATWSLERDAALVTTVTGAPGVPFAIRGANQQGALVVPFVTPEVRLGYAVTRMITAELGVAGVLLFGLDRAVAGDTGSFHAGVCPSDDKNVCQGKATFAPESLFASAIFGGGVTLGANARF